MDAAACAIRRSGMTDPAVGTATAASSAAGLAMIRIVAAGRDAVRVVCIAGIAARWPAICAGKTGPEANGVPSAMEWDRMGIAGADRTPKGCARIVDARVVRVMTRVVEMETVAVSAGWRRVAEAGCETGGS